VSTTGVARVRYEGLVGPDDRRALPGVPRIMRAPDLDLAEAVRGNFARLDEVRQRHQPGTAPVLGGRDRLLVVKVVRTGWRQEVDVVEGKAAAGEVAAVHAHSHVSPVRIANRHVGEVEGVAVD